VKDDAEAVRIVRSAIDRGMTFLDNCWDYHDGRSETLMGRALRDGYRDRAFLMSKIDGRTRAAAARQIDESLQRLQADRVDLMQLHEVIRLEDPDRAFAEGGAMEALQAAQRAGKVRYIGFIGHKDPLVHLRMLEVAQDHGFAFDAVQLPLNVLDAHFRSFEKRVLPVLVQQGIGVLGMKPLAGGKIPEHNVATAVECLQYAMNLPVSVVITGIESMADLDQVLEAAITFRPLSEAELSALLARTAPAARELESFKTDVTHDGTAQHIEWLGYNL
jgi:aryl-alcohol dehydrogenase-like predicted oxidoreductase